MLAATRISLIHRGNGTGPDADSGWEKAWRTACWAQLQDTETYYTELKYTISEDFGENLFSLYNPNDASPIFQIDANLGYPAALIVSFFSGRCHFTDDLIEWAHSNT